jgi:hypothetical protein
MIAKKLRYVVAVIGALVLTGGVMAVSTTMTASEVIAGTHN